jgi:hypothetical protein
MLSWDEAEALYLESLEHELERKRCEWAKAASAMEAARRDLFNARSQLS